MNLNVVFDLVRQEQVILWVGSGFSLYAGYPSGQEMANKLYQSMTPYERSQIEPNLALPDVAEQYVRLKGDRSLLNLLLQKELLKAPISIKWHHLLASIPHIKTIITSNYDRLFELAYKAELQPIIFDNDIAHRNDKVELYKIHGDINHLETIVITKSDYGNFFYNRRSESLFWSVIKERISNKHIVFVGYDLEDENIKNILREIVEALGPDHKIMFAVAPRFKKHKIDYLSRLGIQYLDLKGEVFVEKLLRNIKDNITADFDKGLVSVETLRKFYVKNQLLVDLKAFEDRFYINSLRSLNDSSGQLSLNFKNKNEYQNPFRELVQGHRFGELVIDGNDLSQLKFLLNDVNIIGDELDKYQITVKSTPKKKGIATLVFEDGSEFEDIKYVLFTSKTLIQITGYFLGAEMDFQVTTSELSKSDILTTFNFKLAKNFKNANEAIKVYSLLYSIARKLGMTVYVDGEKNGVYLKPGDIEFDLKVIESNLGFFSALKDVERIYGVRFNDIRDYSKEDFDNAYKAVDIANEKVHEQFWDEQLSWSLDKEGSLELLLKINDGAQLTIESEIPEVLEILGEKINVGYLTAEPLDLYIVNLDDLNNKKTSKLTVKSKSKKIRLFYKKSLLQAEENIESKK